MAYLILARKWRPQVFDELIGQEHVTRTLKNSIESGKLAHAYLFVGPRGVGKTSCARILAKSLNCKDAPTANPCGKCSACIEIAESRSLDVIEIDGASNRGIDEIRTLRENVKFSPISGKYKIYIIDEVHMLTQEAFNALLKTLEEPPEHVKFIFATTQPNKVLPTILSRCQRFDFGYIPTLKIIAKLKEVAQKEKIHLDDNAFFDIARLAEGSMRDAESLLDQLSSFSKDRITSQDIISIMGVMSDDAFFDLIQAVKNKDLESCINFISKLFTQGKDIFKFMEGLMLYVRNLMMAKIMRSNLEQICDLPKERIEKIKQQSNDMALSEIVSMFSEITLAQDMAKKIGSFRIPLEVMMIKLTGHGVEAKGRKETADYMPEAKDKEKSFVSKLKLDNVGSLFRPVNKKTEAASAGMQDPDQQKEITGSSKEQVRNKDVFHKDEPKRIDFAELKDNWPRVIDSIASVKMSLATYLRGSEILRLDGDTLVVGFVKKSLFYKEAAEQRHNAKIITDKLKEMFGLAVSLACEFTEEVPLEISAGESSELVDSALDTFQGRVIKKE